MKRAGIKDEVKEVINELRGKSLKEILSYALTGEVDSTKLYKFLYKKLPDGYPKMKFLEFMRIEQDHDEKVMRIFKALFPREEPLKVELKTWPKIFEERDFRLEKVKDYLDVLEIGMDAEQLAEGVYLMLADILEEPDYKRLFLKLAEDERDHYNFLKDEYEFYSRIEAEKSLKELIEELKKAKASQA
ncbi:hypothetical protein containing Rubrerythrin subfamily-like domain [Pyrococcus sp. ST04]|nr:hypothetical protein containing Rubrerythrin subfamily-like domain [Pyrococcus sp. ST04]